MVGFPIISYQRSTGIWLVMMIERASYRSSTISSRSWALVGVERLWPPVIKNEQIETSDSAQHLGVTAIGAAECEGGEETRHVMVRN